MNQQILITCSIEDIEAIIIKNVNKAMQAHGVSQSANGAPLQNEFLTKNEAAKMLQVSKGSLDNWSKAGILKPTRIGSLVRYKRIDIEQALNGKGVNHGI